MSDLIPFNFHGDALECIPEGDALWVGVRAVCEAVDIQHQPQLEKLRAKSWAITQMVKTTAADGREREVFCIDLDSLPMWLATIDERRVPEEIRPKLIRYQREAKKALAEFFFKKTDPRDALIADLRRQLAQRPAPAIRPTDIAVAWARAHLEQGKEPMPLGELWPHFVRWSQSAGQRMPGSSASLGMALRSIFHQQTFQGPFAMGHRSAYYCQFRAEPLPVELPQQAAPRQQSLPLPMPTHDMLAMKVAELCGKVEMLIQQRGMGRRPARAPRCETRGPMAEMMSLLRERLLDYLPVTMEPITTAQIIEDLRLPAGRLAEAAIGRVLGELGYRRSRCPTGDRPYIYTKTQAN